MNIFRKLFKKRQRNSNRLSKPFASLTPFTSDDASVKTSDNSFLGNPDNNSFEGFGGGDTGGGGASGDWYDNNPSSASSEDSSQPYDSGDSYDSSSSDNSDSSSSD